MENEIKEIAKRIKGLRLILEMSREEMAKATDVSVEEYTLMEDGEEDFAFTFLYKCANVFGVDIAELLTGQLPKLSFYSVTRKDKGLPIKRRKGFTYLHKATVFKNKISEPFYVTAPYSKEAEKNEIHLSTHKGQELDYIVKGSLKVVLEGGHEEILNEGDMIYYDSSHGHGMVATGGEDCEFLAIVMREEKGE